jgi:hypothetical protein
MQQDPKEGGGPAIARRPVASDTIRSMGYDLAQGVLEIEFVSGAVFRYHAVPRWLWYGLKDAAEKGDYFESHVRGEYTATRMR